jgi:DNA-binding CsgD family transcriptional regulator
VNILGEMPWGSHLCLFYETKRDLLDTLVPYFKTGLESNESCVWATSEPLTVEEARSVLRREVADFDRHLASGRMEILPGREWYLPGDRFDLQKVTGGWEEKLRLALAGGFDGIRVSGNAFWLVAEHWKEFRDYEHELDRSLAGRPMIMLCTYPLHNSRAADILEVAQAHQLTVARRNGAWEFIEAVQAPSRPQGLTPREREVLSWAARGKSAAQIGEILRITKRTANEHIQNAMRKLGAQNRTQAVAIALRERLLDLHPKRRGPAKIAS